MRCYIKILTYIGQTDRPRHVKFKERMWLICLFIVVHLTYL